MKKFKEKYMTTEVIEDIMTRKMTGDKPPKIAAFYKAHPELAPKMKNGKPPSYNTILLVLLRATDPFEFNRRRQRYEEQRSAKRRLEKQIPTFVGIFRAVRNIFKKAA